VAVTVVDKGQGIGGRLASRRLRWDPDPQVIGIADYGALQFQVSDRRFQTQVDRWVEQGLLRSEVPSNLLPSATRSPVSALAQPFYTGTASLRSFTQALSQGLTLHLKTRITQLHWQPSTQSWILSALNAAGSPVTLPWQSTHLVLTCPVPQTLELLDQSGIAIPPAQRQPLQSVHYHPCLTALLLLRHPSQIPPPGLIAGRDPELPEALQALRCHYRSGISPQGYAVTLQASPTFSQQHWDQDDRSILETLITLASPWLNLTPSSADGLLTQQLHRWRYSQPAQSYAQTDRPCCILQPTLILGGDAFATPDHPPISPHLSLQQGFLSGLSIAETIVGVNRG
jgi:predicted NAD/FAD-dependent oxidoreductase